MDASPLLFRLNLVALYDLRFALLIPLLDKLTFSLFSAQIQSRFKIHTPLSI